MVTTVDNRKIKGRLRGFAVFGEIPKGWVICETSFVPRGYKYIVNTGKRRLGEELCGLISLEDLGKESHDQKEKSGGVKNGDQK